MSSKKTVIVLSMAVLIAVLSLAGVARLYKELQEFKNLPATKADTVHVANTPKKVINDLQDARASKNSFLSKLGGTHVLKPSDGVGPVTVFDTPVKTDTALAGVTLKNGKLATTLQVPDTTPGQSHLVSLPVKNVGHCNDITIGGNGTTRCKVPPLGVLDIEANAAMDPTTQKLDADIGLSWKRYKDSPLTLRAYTKPEELKDSKNPKVYVGARLTIGILGH